MSKKIFLLISIAVILLLGAIAYIYLHPFRNSLLPDESKIAHVRVKDFSAKVLIVNKNFLDNWYSSKTEDYPVAPYIATVTAGTSLFFPIVFSHFSFDKNGQGLVTAVITLTSPNGKIISQKEYSNIAEGIPAENANLGFIQKGIFGDNFTSNEDPQKYPLGIYTVKAIVTDKISGKTIEDTNTVEKVN